MCLAVISSFLALEVPSTPWGLWTNAFVISSYNSASVDSPSHQASSYISRDRNSPVLGINHLGEPRMLCSWHLSAVQLKLCGLKAQCSLKLENWRSFSVSLGFSDENSFLAKIRFCSPNKEEISQLTVFCKVQESCTWRLVWWRLLPYSKTSGMSCCDSLLHWNCPQTLAAVLLLT